MTATDDIDVLAGEYVLGTLPAAERATVAARRGREPAVRQTDGRRHTNKQDRTGDDRNKDNTGTNEDRRQQKAAAAARKRTQQRQKQTDQNCSPT